jgi:hypothetical protein
MAAIVSGFYNGHDVGAEKINLMFEGRLKISGRIDYTNFNEPKIKSLKYFKFF